MVNQSKGLLVVFQTVLAIGYVFAGFGCTEHDPKYGVEDQMVFPARHREVWAVAPAINLSGYQGVDPLLQADLLYEQLQQVRGLTVIPVNRVAQVYATLRIEKVETEEQAAIVCELLGCDRLIVPTITAYDPYVPPKMGASLQVLSRSIGSAQTASVDPHEMARQSAPPADLPAPPPPSAAFVQAVGMFDAANGSVREALLGYAAGRHDPMSPMAAKEYLSSMDRFCGFVYHELIAVVITKADRVGYQRSS